MAVSVLMLILGLAYTASAQSLATKLTPQQLEIIKRTGHHPDVVLYPPIEKIVLPMPTIHPVNTVDENTFSSGTIAGIACGSVILLVDLAIVYYVWKNRESDHVVSSASSEK
eukprot:scpid95774/ scgid8893/ 